MVNGSLAGRTNPHPAWQVPQLRSAFVLTRAGMLRAPHLVIV
jgi:hypothetical protein